MINTVPFSSNFRYKYVALLSALMAVVLMLVFADLPDTILFWRELQNSAHTLVFAAIAILILMLLRELSHFFWQTPFKLYIAAGSISLLIATLTEMIQMFTARDASLMDLARDLAGILAGLGLYATIDSRLQTQRLMSAKKLRAGIVVLSVFLFTASMLPLASLSSAYLQREDEFPIVADLSANWTRPFLRLNNAVISSDVNNEVRVETENRFTRVTFMRGTYPGFSIIETTSDWSAYSTFSLAIYSKKIQPFELVLRVHDAQHNYSYTDRFNTVLTINKGINYFNIPLEAIKNAPTDRKMDMSRITKFTLFSAQPAEGLIFYSDAMRLE
ncbi:MAG: VanZ family protein [Gammaproteobacteria bacterium]|nr:VanZ family protein [Gammaproteobacteria bacterium]